MEEKPKSLLRLFLDLISMVFSWWKGNKIVQQHNQEEFQQQKINEANKVNENLQNQYNKIDENKNDDKENMTIDEINDKLNEKLK